MEEMEKLQYEDELKANRFSTIFVSVMCSICLLIWLANEMGIFVVNGFYMRVGMAIGCTSLLIPILVYFAAGGKNKWFKYMFIICMSITCIAMQSFLTFHAVMLCVLPILLAVQYADMRVYKLAFWINLFGVLVSVILGYYVGCWDGNMIYATTYGITVKNDFIRDRIAIMNQEYMIQLLLYFAVPRMIIFSVISMSTSYILKTANLQYVRQNLIRMQAESDGLTGLANRAKYFQRVSEEYTKLNSIYIVYLDVNYLKVINDTCGHETGDRVLKRAAEEMNRIVNKNIHGYRLGGDEFALIFCNYSERDAKIIMEQWEKGLKPLSDADAPAECSFAIGCSYGERPFDIPELLKRADDNMYARKKEMKKSIKNRI